jgi:NTP pyrophosphatase (non-canonical NTP hydrolase)
MKEQQRLVQEFHEKIRQSISMPFPTTEMPCLRHVGEELIRMSEAMERMIIHDPSQRALRAHLKLEEVGEWLLAMAAADEVAAADGLADILFVTLGDAVTYGHPAEDLFMEVAMSNLTKRRKSHEDVRVRDKGAAYLPPDIKGVLKRCKQ